MTLDFFMHRFEASKNVLIELLAVYYTLTCISSFFSTGIAVGLVSGKEDSSLKMIHLFLLYQFHTLVSVVLNWEMYQRM